MEKKFEMTVEKTNTGYSAYCEPMGAYTTGATADELKANILVVLNMAKAEGTPEITLAQVKMICDLPSFFDTYKELNASKLAKRMGMTQSMLSQYTSGAKKAGPKQTAKILAAVRELGRELAEVDFA